MSSQDMYRDHMTECLIKTGVPPARAAEMALREYPDTNTGK
jgi:hypothetical protein